MSYSWGFAGVRFPKSQDCGIKLMDRGADGTLSFLDPMVVRENETA